MRDRMLPTHLKLSLLGASALVAAVALPGCSSNASTAWGNAGSDLSSLHKEAGGDDDDAEAQGDDASPPDAATGDASAADAPADDATSDASNADAGSTADGAADDGAADAGDGACPCGVVDPYTCDQLTQKCAQNPSCSSCSQLSQVCACAPCDDAGHKCH
jgi:hypothetical protein